MKYEQRSWPDEDRRVITEVFDDVFIVYKRSSSKTQETTWRYKDMKNALPPEDWTGCNPSLGEAMQAAHTAYEDWLEDNSHSDNKSSDTEDVSTMNSDGYNF